MSDTLNGVINVYKEAGFTSHDVVAKLRGILHTRKVGHTGTLDPDAVGVLPVCVGSATKLCDMLTDETKEYIALLRLGIITDTQDMSGNIISDNQNEVDGLSEKEIENVILSFLGESMQILPMYSALKVDGQKLYDLARKGIEVERKPRPIRIDELEILRFVEKGLVEIRVVCSKGTYIRTLCNDIGQKLGCGGCMEHLTRSRVGDFRIKDSLTLGQIQEIKDGANGVANESATNFSLHNIVKPIDQMFLKYEALHVTVAGEKALLNGNQLPEDIILEVNNNNIMLTAKQNYRIYNKDDIFFGIYEYHSGWKVLKPFKMFMPEEFKQTGK